MSPQMLEHYIARGDVELIPLTLPAHQPNQAWLRHLYLKKKTLNKRQNEVIPYNDCLYRQAWITLSRLYFIYQLLL